MLKKFFSQKKKDSPTTQKEVNKTISQLFENEKKA